MRNFHNKAMIHLAEKMGSDISDEPRFKHVSGLLHSIMNELKTLRDFKEHHYVGKN
jgi:hypothetical protein